MSRNCHCLPIHGNSKSAKNIQIIQQQQQPKKKKVKCGRKDERIVSTLDVYLKMINDFHFIFLLSFISSLPLFVYGLYYLTMKWFWLWKYSVSENNPGRHGTCIINDFGVLSPYPSPLTHCTIPCRL